jgi:hypothetical protein
LKVYQALNKSFKYQSRVLYTGLLKRAVACGRSFKQMEIFIDDGELSFIGVKAPQKNE